jgi:hypothetical protein
MKNWAMFAILATQSCSNKNDVPPALATCGGDGCHPGSGITVVPGAGTGGTNSATEGDGGVTLTINAVAFASSSSDSNAWSLSNVKSVTEAVNVQASSAAGTVVSSTSSSPIVLTGVSTNNYAWVSAKPTSTSSAYLSSIVSIANWTTGDVSIPLLAAVDLDFVSSLLTTSTLTLDSAKAQLAIKIVDINGNGVKNARIKDPGAATVAYADSGVWIDVSLEPYTDLSGRVVIVNLPAPTAAGTFATITAYGNNSSGVQVTSTGTLPIEAGFVSYGTILLDLR